MRILITDDHALFREAAVLVLQQLDRSVNVLEAGDARSALRLLEHYGPFDLALLDMRLPDVGGVEAISRCLSLSPQTPVVAISGDESPRLIDAAIGAGAAGFVPKSANSREFIAALRQVLAGDIYLPTRFLDLHPPAQFGPAEHVDDVTQGELNGEAPAQPDEQPSEQVNEQVNEQAATWVWQAAQPTDAASQQCREITDRQLQVLQLISKGMSNKGIGQMLGISEGTVKQHVSKLLGKFAARNRTEAVAAATRFGLLGAAPPADDFETDPADPADPADPDSTDHSEDGAGDEPDATS